MFEIGHTYREKHGSGKFEVLDAIRSTNGTVYYWGWWESNVFPETGLVGATLEEGDFIDFVKVES